MLWFSSDAQLDQRNATTRAKFLATIALTFLCSLPGLAASPPVSPNILLFIGDDWGRNASCYRDPARPGVNDVLRTPNIDRLAGEGILFTNAFYNIASCVESRGSIATGCYFWRLGKTAFHRPDPGWKDKDDPGRALPGFGTLLRKRNYLVASWGKTLNANWLSADQIPWEKTKHRYSLWVPTQPDRAAAEKEIEKIFRSGVDQMLAKRKKDQPFCYVVGPIGAHRPFSKGTGKSLWGIDPDNLKGKMPAFLPDVAESREDMADALGEICATDLYIGWIIDELRKTGELDNTLVVLTGDNGMGMPRAKAHVYDMGVRAPLIVRWPNGIPKPGRAVDDFVNIVDLAPTFLEVAGAELPQMDGHSLLPLLKSDKDGVVDPKRDFVVVGRERHEPNARPGGLPYPVRAIRTADFLYIRNFKPDRWPSGDPSTKNFPTDPSERGSGTIEWIITHRDHPLFALNYGKRPAEELYDLRKDPDEVKNIADDPADSDTKKTLSERLLRIMRQTKDPRLTDAFDRPPYYRGPVNVEKDGNNEMSIDRSDPNCIAHVNGGR